MVESSALFNGKTSPVVTEEDIQTEHNQNLANAMRNYLVTLFVHKFFLY
jgi:hypothetical protein